MAFFRSVATVGLFTLLSRGLGFVRDLATAILLGAGPVADAFVFAQRLPQIVRGMFVEGSMDSAFIPIYVRKLRLEGPGSAQKFMREIFTLLLIIILPFTGLCLYFIPELVGLLAPGFVEDPERFKLAVNYSGITFGYLVLILLTVLQGSVLNAHRRFAPLAMAPLGLNLVIISALTIAAVLKKDVALIGCWSFIAGGVLQLLLVWISGWKEGVGLSFIKPRLSRDVRQFFRRAGPGVLSGLILQISGIISGIFASTLPAGIVASLYYADKLTQLPVDVIGVGIATVLLPMLTHHITAGENTQAVHSFSRAVEFALALALLPFMFLLLEAEPIVRLLFQYGAFTPEDTRITAMCLASYAVMIPGSIFMNVLVACCFASGNIRTPVIAGLAAMAVNAASAFLFTPLWAHVGVAFAYALAVWTGVGVAAWALLRKKFFRLDKEARRRLPLLLFSGLALGGVLLGMDALELRKLFNFLPEGPLRGGFALLVEAVVATGVYVAAVHFTGAMRFQEVLKLLRKKSL
jgi:putative peptidoglycan lipid II flippase